jgi:hypothetical protein
MRIQTTALIAMIACAGGACGDEKEQRGGAGDDCFQGCQEGLVCAADICVPPAED